MMNPCCCTGCAGCRLGVVAAAANLTVVRGEWIDGGLGAQTADADGLAYQQLCTTWDGSYVVWTEGAFATAVGDRLRLIFRHADEDDYDCVELEFGGVGGSYGDQSGYVRFIERSGGSESLVGDEEALRWLVANPAGEGASPFNVHIFCLRDGSDVRVLLQISTPVSEISAELTTHRAAAERTFTYPSVRYIGMASGDTNTGEVGTVEALVTEMYSLDLDPADENCVETHWCWIHKDPLEQDSLEAATLEEFDAFGDADWTIESDGIHAQTGSGQLLDQWENYTDNDAVYATVTVTGHAQDYLGDTIVPPGVEAGLIVDALDEDNYHAVIVYGDPDNDYTMTLRVVKVSAGAETVLAKISGFSDPAVLYACVRDGNIAANGLSAVTTLHGGKRVGLYASAVNDYGSTYSDADLIFTDLEYRLSNECDAAADPERDCAACRPCDSDPVTPTGYAGKLPLGLLIEVSGAADSTCSGGLGCGEFNGTFTATPDQSSLGGNSCGVSIFGTEALCDLPFPAGFATGPAVSYSISETEITVIVNFTTGDASTATFTYTLSGGELCDLTGLTDAAMTLDSHTNAACDFSGLAVSISAIPTL